MFLQGILYYGTIIVVLSLVQFFVCKAAVKAAIVELEDSKKNA